MLIDDIEPRSPPAKPKPLDPLSVDELYAYVAALKGEIARAEAEIAAKQAHLNAASALFEKPGFKKPG
jgi:uncharacterized small protein (DUF1192 family)